MKMIGAVKLWVALAATVVSAFMLPSRSRSAPGSLYFKPKGDDGPDATNNEEGEGGVWRSIKRFLPGVVRARLEKNYAAPVEETGMRFRVVLLSPRRQLRRHAVTRLTRWLPDLTFESAADIVDTAIRDERALVRVFNSLDEALYLQRVLAQADPPVVAEVIDNKKGDVL